MFYKLDLKYFTHHITGVKTKILEDNDPTPSLFFSNEFERLLGVSRKSSIYKTLGITADEALNGTTVLHTLGLLNGASILRVHDVKEAKEAILLIAKMNT